MIQRRGFFGKLAGMFGLTALPVQASEESAERKLRREKMATKGLGPDDVQTSFVWDRDSDGNVVLRLYIDCHGETYGQAVTLWPSDPVPKGLHFLVTRTRLKSIEAPAIPRHW